MNFEFGQLIREIESEIQTEYLGGAIQWADSEFNGAWSKAIDDFDMALNACIDRHDYVSAKQAAESYREKILSMIRMYKKMKRLDEAEEFLASLRETGG